MSLYIDALFLCSDDEPLFFHWFIDAIRLRIKIISSSLVCPRPAAATDLFIFTYATLPLDVGKVP